MIFTNLISRFRMPAILMFAVILVSCESGTDVVESGTYRGSIKKVNPEKSEIYVTTDDDKVLELYFTDNTELTYMGDPVMFEILEVGQPVEVVVEKSGKRLDPISVEILE